MIVSLRAYVYKSTVPEGDCYIAECTDLQGVVGSGETWNASLRALSEAARESIKGARGGDNTSPSSLILEALPNFRLGSASNCYVNVEL